MFRDSGQFDEGAFASGGPAVLLPSQVVTEPDLGHRVSALQRLRQRMETWFARADLAPDLAADIGSRRWFRGLGTMLGLGVLALSLWPDFSHVEAATALPAGDRVRDEYRSQMILPLALGGDSGRRMGATSAVHALRGMPERPLLQLVATMAQGDSLSRMLARAGLNQDDAAHVTGLVTTTLAGSPIAPGTQFDITLGQRPQPGTPRLLQSLDFRARFDLDLRIVRSGAGLVLERRPIAVDATPLRIRGQVGSSLYRSARNAGAPLGVIQDYLQAIDQHVSIENDLAAGDSFDIVVAYKRSAQGERQIGELLYAGIERAGRPRLQLLRWGPGGAMMAAGDMSRAEAQPMGAPVAGHITSTFGLRRHPILGFVRRHAGVDYGARYGSPIYAVAAGTVSFAGRHGGHGNYVRLDHGGGNGTGYAHMSRIAVSAGGHVQAGQVIGYVGSTGLSTGPHLHFEAYQGGRTINPMGLRFAARPQMNTEELSAFRRRLASILAIRPGAALGPVMPGPQAADLAGREIDRVAATDSLLASPPRRLALAGELAKRN